MNRILHGLVVVICIVFFVILAGKNIAIYFKYPTATSKSVEDLSHVGFPNVEICLKMGYNHSVLKHHGYNSLADYGKGMSNNTFIGWSGNLNHSTASLLENAFLLNKSNDLIKSVGLTTFNDTNDTVFKSVELEPVEARYPEGKCFSIVWSNVLIKPNINAELIIMLRNINNASAKVVLTDPQRKSWKKDPFAYNGNQIEKNLDKSSEGYIDIVHINMVQNIDFELDPEANCQNYGQGHYDKCVSTTTKRHFQRVLGCTPPWFVLTNDSSMCKGNFSANHNYNQETIWRFMDQNSFEVMTKLDGVGPVDNRPSTNKLHHFVRKKKNDI